LNTKYDNIHLLKPEALPAEAEYSENMSDMVMYEVALPLDYSVKTLNIECDNIHLLKPEA
jgi:hypothetical protein